MKFTLSWLREYLDTQASLEQIADKLTFTGLEVENIEDPAEDLAAFRAAYVVSAKKHPDADRLKVCMVDTGGEKLQVVCGAPNARAGMIGVFAHVGSYIPGIDMKLKKGIIRGVESHGMLVSEREMGLSEDHEGIIELPENTPLGTPIAQALGLCDPVLDIAITPNRADCTGVYGVARDLAAAGIGNFKPLKTAPLKGSYESPVRVEIQTGTNPLFVGRYIRGVKNGPSPGWLQQRLKAVGLRPISALVDITNYMALAFARPLHVYDADRIKGNIHVRLSNKGECFEALNDKSYELDEGHTVICDDSGVLGLGGIVGGISTGSEEDTVNVFVESAYFTPAAIARTGRDLQIESDARYRFERGIDPEFTHTGMEIATKMILDICGGEASEVVVAGKAPEWHRVIEYNPDFCMQLGGLEVSRTEQKQILENLGFKVTGEEEEAWAVEPPSWRGDVAGRADIVEEVLRIKGFDKLPAISVHNSEAVTHPAETRQARLVRLARTSLAASGLDECITWSFMQTSLARKFGANDQDKIRELTLVNPINAELDLMRPTSLPNLIAAAGRNCDRGYPDTALFEVGPVFHSADESGQVIIAAGALSGNSGPRHWSGPDASRIVDAYDAKACAMSVLETCNAPADNLLVGRDAGSWYHPGRSGTLALGKTVLAQFGEIHPVILEEMDIKVPVVGFEIYLDQIPVPRDKGKARQNLDMSQFQPVSRDFAFIVDYNVEAESLIRAVKNTDKRLIKDVYVFDIYTGKGVEEGKKSVALSVVIQPREKTLTETEIESISQKIADSISSKTGGILRT